MVSVLDVPEAGSRAPDGGLHLTTLCLVLGPPTQTVTPRGPILGLPLDHVGATPLDLLLGAGRDGKGERRRMLGEHDC